MGAGICSTPTISTSERSATIRCIDEVWDPMVRMERVKMPVLWLSWPRGQAFPARLPGRHLSGCAGPAHGRAHSRHGAQRRSELESTRQLCLRRKRGARGQTLVSASGDDRGTGSSAGASFSQPDPWIAPCWFQRQTRASPEIAIGSKRRRRCEKDGAVWQCHGCFAGRNDGLVHQRPAAASSRPVPTIRRSSSAHDTHTRLDLVDCFLAWPFVPRAVADDSVPFSWDHVPVYAHVGKQSDDFTPQELDFLADHFDFITFEKGQAVRKRGSAEAGIAEAARQIKHAQAEREGPVLLERLSRHQKLSGQSRVSRRRTSDGSPRAASHGSPDGSHLRPHPRRSCATGGRTPPPGQCGRVPVMGFSPMRSCRSLRPENAGCSARRNTSALNSGLVAMLDETSRKLGPDKLIIFNGLRGDDGAQFLPHTSGAMIEHFGHFSGIGKEKMAEDLEAMRDAARTGKIVCFKAWPGFSWLDADMMKRPHEELASLARERLTFPLACFLVAAEPRCYFSYTWGYGEDHGTFDWYPEFDKPLGPPLGEAKKNGWTYQREFAHASVFVDLDTETARIHWKP